MHPPNAGAPEFLSEMISRIGSGGAGKAELSLPIAAPWAGSWPLWDGDVMAGRSSLVPESGTWVSSLPTAPSGWHLTLRGPRQSPAQSRVMDSLRHNLF